MDWSNCLALWLALLPLAMCWTPVQPAAAAKSSTSPYIDMLLCPVREESWSCAREQSARILDIWDGELITKWQQLKVEADIQLNATLQKRGYSVSEIPTKEKPSTILKKIEIGSNFMKQYLAETFDGFLGREYEDPQDYDTTQQDDDEGDDNEYNNNDEENVATADDVENEYQNVAEDADAEEVDYVDDNNSDNNEEEEEEEEPSVATPISSDKNNSLKDVLANSSGGDEFIEIADATAAEGQLKRPSVDGGKNKNKNKNKRKNKNKNRRKKGQKGQHAALETQPATLLLVQQAPQPPAPTENEAIQLHSGDLGTTFGGNGHVGPNKLAQKRRKRKKHGQKQGHSGSAATVLLEEAPSNHIGVQLLEELVGEPDLFGSVVGGGKRRRQQKFPTKYGRSNGVTRGKKKKKKKALMKLILLGSFLKAKIELLLKLIGTHLQVKFLAIALIGLVINIARFWIDVKRGGVPHKVVYVEHAHHQHHYEDHGDEWGEGGAGSSYWKRSLTEENAEGGSTASYEALRPQYDSHYLAYRSHRR